MAASAVAAPLLERAENPVLRFGKQLGRDELYAAVFSAVTTALAFWVIEWLAGGETSVGLTALILPWVGPVLEKPGLLAHYLSEGIAEWRRGKGALWACLRRALFDGRAWRTLRVDVLIHDPCYGGMLALGVWLLTPSSGIAVAFLSSLCFVAAVLVAAAIEVALVEFGHHRLARRLGRLGFTSEDYCETRYLIVADDQRNAPVPVLERIAEAFELPDRLDLHYEDHYYAAHRLPECNGRVPHVRVRTVTVRRDDGPDRVLRWTLQVVYTRPGEVGRDAASLFRCFAVSKQKFALDCGGHNPESAARMAEVLVELGASGEPRVVRFRRLVARNPAGLLVSVDVLTDRDDAPGTFWIEAKVRRDVALLQRANEFVAMHFPVRGTTRNKLNLVEELAEFRSAEAA